MAFTVEQGGKHAATGRVGLEHDPVKKSLTTDQAWRSENPVLNKDIIAQASADGFVLSSTMEPSIKVADSSPFSLGISFERGSENTFPSRGIANGEVTPGVAPCTPCPSFLQQKSQWQRSTKLSHALPSLYLGIGIAEGQQVQCMQRQTDPEMPNSPNEFSHELSTTNSPRSLFITPTHGCESFPMDVQREGLEPYREDMMTSMLSTHEMHVQERDQPHPALSLGHFAKTQGLQKSPARSRNFKLSILEGDAQYTQDADFAQYIRGELGSDRRSRYDLPHRGSSELGEEPSVLLVSEAGGCSQSFSECFNSFAPGLVRSSHCADPSKSVVLSNYSASEKALDCALPQKTVPDALVANMACSVSCSPPVKQDWSKILTKFMCGNLPAVSGQQNVGISFRHERECPEKRSKLLLSQRSLSFRGSGECSQFNGSSCSLPYRDEARQNAQTFEQHRAVEALEEDSDPKTSWHGQPLRPVNLAKVKIEIDYEESNGRQYTCRDGAENDEIGKCEMKPQSKVGFLESGCSATHAPSCSSDVVGDLQVAGPQLLRTSMCAQMPQVLSTVSAGGPSICFFNDQSQKSTDLKEQTTPMSRTSQIDGGWGKFLALSASAVGDTRKSDTEIVLPFQRRFKQLQEFLKQCDTSDKYSLQAFWSMSAAARSCHAVDQETRAVRLSFEEGKELKRMKLLNVLGKASEGPNVSSFYGTRLPTPDAIVQVKQES